MSPVTVIFVILAYFALLLILSALSGGSSAGNEAFFRGGRRTPWPIVAIAMIGASISGVTFISVPGMVVGKGYAYLQMALGFTVGYMLIACYLLPLFYRKNLTSVYSYLEQRFGTLTHRTGAWFFFISKLLGASVRFFVVCVVLQMLVFEPLHIPFFINVLCSVALIGLYTAGGGVRTLIVTDLLKSLCLIGSVVLCIIFIGRELGLNSSALADAVTRHETSRIFFFDDPRSGLYFWKQFIAGVFLSVACNGLDQDQMQRNFACKNHKAARKNLIVAALMQLGVIALFLALGTILTLYVESRTDLSMPDISDRLFGLVATDSAIPAIIGIVFVIGLISAGYSAAGSAITSMTTSFTIDILRHTEQTVSSEQVTRTRRRVHPAMTAIMAVTIIIFYYLIEDDAISAVYTLASITYGPILGLFILGLFTKFRPDDRMVPIACILAPILSWIIREWLLTSFDYTIGFELLLLNAFLTALIAVIPVPTALFSRSPQPSQGR